MTKVLKKYYPIAILFLFSLIISTPLFKPGIFSMADEMHLFRLQQYVKCMGDGQIPCRIIENGGLGYSYPLFNYYPPLIYFSGWFFNYIGFSLIDSLKIVFFSTNIIAAVGFYYFSKIFFKKDISLVCSILFLLAPYRAVDFYVRGALAELMALSIAPWLFWSAFSNRYRLIPIITSLLFLTHNLYSLVFIPLSLLLFIIKNKKINTNLVISYLLGFFIAAFFLIPAMVEKDLVTVSTMTQDYFDFHNHFSNIYQLFIDRSWGFGASLWGPKDDMSFQIGYLLWILPTLSFMLIILKKTSQKVLYITSFLAFLFFIFLTHSRSTFIWELFPFMAYFQFPWRFLGPVILIGAFLSGIIISKIPKLLIYLIVILQLFLNINYFREDRWLNINDSYLSVPENIFRLSAAGLRDYWPRFSDKFPETMANTYPEVVPENSTRNISYAKTSNKLTLEIEVNKESTIKLPLVYFPGWVMTINGLPRKISYDSLYGQISFNLPSGKHLVSLFYQQTPIQKYSNILSLISVFCYVIFLFRGKSYDKIT